jgi:hypothetical protein
MSRPDLDIPELHLALTTAARQRPRSGTSAFRLRAPRTSAVRTRAVAILCVAAVALAGVFAVASPATTPGPGAPVAGASPAVGGRSTAPARPADAAAPSRSAEVDPSSTPSVDPSAAREAGLLRCALASIPETVLPATVVIRGAGSC